MVYPAACCDFSTEALEGLTKYTASFTWSGAGFKMEIFAFFCLLSFPYPLPSPFFGIQFYHWQWNCSANFRFVVTVFKVKWKLGGKNPLNKKPTDFIWPCNACVHGRLYKITWLAGKFILIVNIKSINW